MHCWAPMVFIGKGNGKINGRRAVGLGLVSRVARLMFSTLMLHRRVAG